jgi:hypothetical protein
VVLIHVTYRAAAAAIDTDAGPSHGSPVNPDTTDAYEAAAELNSAANPCHAAAAANIGSAPAPAYIRPEFTSGGNAAKSTTTSTRTGLPNTGDLPHLMLKSHLLDIHLTL